MGTGAGVVRRADGSVEVLDGLFDAEAINSAGEIIGLGLPLTGTPTPAIWRQGVVTSLTPDLALGTGYPPNSWYVRGFSESGHVLIDVNFYIVFPPNVFESYIGTFVFDAKSGLRRIGDLVVGGTQGTVSTAALPVRILANGDIISPSTSKIYRRISDAMLATPDGAAISIGATDRTTFAVITTASGFSTVLLRANDEWAALVVGTRHLGEPGEPSEVRAVHTFVNPRTGRMQALITGTKRTVLVSQSTEWGSPQYFGLGVPQFRDDVVAVDDPIVGESAVFASPDGRMVLVGAGADGRLLARYEVPGNAIYSVDGYNWVLTDMADLLAESGQTPVPVAGSVSAFTTPWGAMSIMYLDAAGDVQAVWWAPGLSTWRIDNLSAAAGAPALHGTLVSFTTSWGGMNVAGTDPDGNVTAVWWAPGMAAWRADRLVSGAPPQLEENSLTAFVAPWGALHVTGLDKATGRLTAYWWAPGMAEWRADEIAIQSAPTDLHLKPQLSSAVSSDGRMFISGITDQGHIANIWFGTETGYLWTFEDVTAAV